VVSHFTPRARRLE